MKNTLCIYILPERFGSLLLNWYYSLQLILDFTGSYELLKMNAIKRKKTNIHESIYNSGCKIKFKFQIHVISRP